MRFRGPHGGVVRSAARQAALDAADIDALIAINRAEFGGHSMVADDDGADDGGDGGGDGSDGGSDGSDDGDGDSGSDQPDPAELERRLAETERRMKAADKRAAEAEKKIKEQEDAEKGELEKAQAELKELQESVAEKDKAIRSLRLENAFLTANKHDWHKPEVALKLADSGGYLENVTDEETGEVDKKALGSALDRLAKDNAFLVKPKDKAGDEPDGPSGEPAGGRSDNSKDQKARRQELKGRFASLANR